MSDKPTNHGWIDELENWANEVGDRLQTPANTDYYSPGSDECDNGGHLGWMGSWAFHSKYGYVLVVDQVPGVQGHIGIMAPDTRDSGHSFLRYVQASEVYADEDYEIPLSECDPPDWDEYDEDEDEE